jgi:DNA-binding CsgD family transcriptional regulator
MQATFDTPLPVPQAMTGPRDLGVMARWLSLSLDHVGRGMLLVGEGACVLHANRLARVTMDTPDEPYPLHIVGGRLRPRCTRDAAALDTAIDGAVRRGLRRLVCLADGALPVAVLPLEAEGLSAALLSLPREAQPRTRDLALQGFARQHGLTEAETAVLEALVAGDMPTEIARRKGVCLSTVRTQISQLRHKTGTRSIRALVERVAGLPPMMAVVQ